MSLRITKTVLTVTAVFMFCFVFFIIFANPKTAEAGNVNTSHGFTLLTAPAGAGTEYLYIIDDNSSMLMVYSIPDPQNKKHIKPEVSWFLPSLFNEVRN